MGIDVVIYFQADEDFSDNHLERFLGNGFDVVNVIDWQLDTYDINGATHVIDTFERYYGPGYERGDWGKICRVLMLLHACPKVKKVWYGGDCNPTPCPPERVLEISKYYMENGERPYRC